MDNITNINDVRMKKIANDIYPLYNDIQNLCSQEQYSWADICLALNVALDNAYEKYCEETGETMTLAEFISQ